MAFWGGVASFLSPRWRVWSSTVSSASGEWPGQTASLASYSLVFMHFNNFRSNFLQQQTGYHHLTMNEQQLAEIL